MYGGAQSSHKDNVDELLVKTIFLIVGFFGNALNIFVLYRRKPTTTNIYLTGISAVDLLRLVLNYMRTLDYYEKAHLHFYYYWKYRGIIDGLSFSCPPMSLLLIVTFTLNRYIAINDPLRRHKFNTKTIAKLIIVAIVIFCIITRIPVGINLRLSTTKTGFNNSTGKFCDLELFKNYTLINTTVPELHAKAYNISRETINGTQLSNLTVLQLLNHSLVMGTGHTFYNDYYHVYGNGQKNYQDYFDEERKYCQVVDYYAVFYGGKTLKTYTIVVLAVIMGVIPITILIFYNFKLILLLRKLNLKRLELTSSIITNTNNESCNQQSCITSWISKENRSIIKLIIIKSVITICRIPHIILMFMVHVKPEARKWVTILTNFGLDFNAAINFFLFCILSANYRKELRVIFMRYRPEAKNIYLKPDVNVDPANNNIAVINGSALSEAVRNERSSSTTTTTSTSTNLSNNV